MPSPHSVQRKHGSKLAEEGGIEYALRAALVAARMEERSMVDGWMDVVTRTEKSVEVKDL